MKKKDIKEFMKLLRNAYPEAGCSLDFNTPFEMVVAVSLSAQCTDERVNKVTPALFKKCPTIKDYAEIDIEELEKLIRSCGFYKNKAKNIKLCAKQVLEKYNGEVPVDIKDLTSLAGVGRKSANVIRLEVFGIATGIAVDTHVKRISKLIGLSNEKDPLKIEQDLLKFFPSEYYKDINHLFIWHGRNCCIANHPKCETCTINRFCKHYKSTKI